MSVTINTITLAVGDTGTYYDTEGFSYAAKVVACIDADQAEFLVKGNTGVETMPDKYVQIKLTEGLHCSGQIVTNPQIIASHTDEVHAFVLD